MTTNPYRAWVDGFVTALLLPRGGDGVLGAMSTPNLMIESSAADVADLIAVLSRQVGEVARNPYHVRLPAWMMDNVRRGGELVGGQASDVANFAFATCTGSAAGGMANSATSCPRATKSPPATLWRICSRRPERTDRWKLSSVPTRPQPRR